LPTITFEAAGVGVRVPGGTRVVLEPTTLELTEQRVGIIGANGSGKSTLARMVNGLVEATTGRVLVDGVDVVKHGAAVRRRVGFAFTDPAAQLVMPTCVEDVELSLRRTVKDARRRRELALDVLARNGLADHADDSVHALSGGQKQLLALAGVLAVDPAILVADEPTTLLDLANTRRVADLLFGLDQQLVLVTHDLDLARRCDRVLVVDSARVVYDGAPAAAVDHYVASVVP
jgi:biotin transport system ATP-binding protein